MGLFGIKSRSERELEAKIIDLNTQIQEVKTVKAENNIQIIGTHVLPFNGEKNIGAIGPITTWIPDYYKLSARSWQAYIETPLAKTIAEKWTGWIIDTGLRLKANPARLVLESEGFVLSKDKIEKFNDTVESRWEIWARSKRTSMTNESNFSEITRDTYLGSKIGGDQLIVLRYDGWVKIQTIDGQRIQNPGKFVSDTGNIISNGVELTPTGKTVGYHVKVKKGMGYEFDFIPAYSAETGLRTAFLVKGTKWRFDYHRGLPVITTVLESLKKIERYQEATIASAEEVAKIAYQVVHQNFSDGSSPLLGQIAESAGIVQNGEPVDALGERLVKQIAATTNKMAYNNPKGAKIETINQSNNLIGFEEFYSSNANIICSAIGIPPNVALSIYNDSFSASRAATKDWDHTMDVEREFFAAQYYNYIYKFWLYTEILTGKIQAEGYLTALSRENYMVVEAYENARFTGPHFPHIDPLKEVNAERAKLGELAKHIPLTTIEGSVEALGTGDSDSNVIQFADELKNAKDVGLEAVKKEVVQPVDKKPKE